MPSAPSHSSSNGPAIEPPPKLRKSESAVHSVASAEEFENKNAYERNVRLHEPSTSSRDLGGSISTKDPNPSFGKPSSSSKGFEGGTGGNTAFIIHLTSLSSLLKP